MIAEKRKLFFSFGVCVHTSAAHGYHCQKGCPRMQGLHRNLKTIFK